MSEELASPIPVQVAPAGTFVTFGQGEDADNAFDDATSSAWHDFGRTQLAPSIVTSSPEAVQILNGTGEPLQAAVNAAVAAVGASAPGSVLAFAVATPNSFTRRRVSVVLEDPTFDLPAITGPLLSINPELAAALRILTAATDEEIISIVELRRPARARYKVGVERHQGKKQTTYGVYLAGSDDRLSSHATASEARRWAVTHAKTVLTAPAQLEVRPQVLIEGTHPVLTVGRARITQRAALRVELCAPKPKSKILGWVFAGKTAAAILPLAHNTGMPDATSHTASHTVPDDASVDAAQTPVLVPTEKEQS